MEFCAAEGRLGVHNPLLAEELAQKATELRGIGWLCQRALELELALAGRGPRYSAFTQPSGIADIREFARFSAPKKRNVVAAA
jgi:hypothetical protein